MKFFSVFCLMFCLAVSSQTVLANSQPERVDDFIKERMQALKIPGLALAVLKNGKVKLTRLDFNFIHPSWRTIRYGYLLEKQEMT